MQNSGPARYALAASVFVSACQGAAAFRQPADSSVASGSMDSAGPGADAIGGADAAQVAVDYGVDGPYAVTTATWTVQGGSEEFDLHAWLPEAPSPRPVVLLAPGLQQPAAAYAVYAHRLASHGIACLIRDDPGILVMSKDVVADLAFLVTTWLPGQASGVLKGRLDPGILGLCGHSRGGKASLLAAEGPLSGRVKAWLGLDPVDASFVAGDGQGRDGIGKLGIPIAMLGAQVPGACSPAADGYLMLYDKASPPAVTLTLVDAGHTHLEEAAECVACGLCTPEGPADKASTLATAVRYTTAFFARELLRDSQVGPGFDGAGVQADLAKGTVLRLLK